MGARGQDAQSWESVVRGPAPATGDSNLQPCLFSLRSSFMMHWCHEGRVSTWGGMGEVSWPLGLELL